MKNNDNASVFAGGVIVLVVVIWLALRAIESLMNQARITFDAAGMAAQSFSLMALKIGMVLGLIAMGFACIFAAIYFSYRYFKIVRRATDLQAEVNRKLTEFSNQMNSILKDYRDDTRFDLNEMSQKLSEALDKPKIAPEIALETAMVALSEPVEALATASSENPPQEQMSPQNVTNPF